MGLREQVEACPISTLYALWEESIVWDRDGVVPEGAVARGIHQHGDLRDVSFVLFAQVLFAEVWRAMYVLSSMGEL